MTEVNSGLHVIELNMDAGGHPFVVHTALLWDEQDVVLVDTGIGGQLEVIRAALAQAGFSLDQLTKIIITHQDRDHIGSLAELVEASGGKVQVLAHEAAVPFLTGEVPLLKSKTLATPVKVDQTLQDEDILPFAGGVQVIYTPGHTPDHISLYHTPSRTVVAGDALTAKDGELLAFDPNYTLNHAEALASVAKLQKLDIDRIIAYHGGVCTEQLQERLRSIVETTPIAE